MKDKMKIDYTHLDAAIVAAIKGGRNFSEDIMYCCAVGNLCREMASKDASGKHALRFLGARLQALRKRGEIVFCRATRTWGFTPQR